MEKIFGYDFDSIKLAQQGGRLSGRINTNKNSDYGADPIGDGTFKMIPSGDIVDMNERNKRLIESVG